MDTTSSPSPATPPPPSHSGVSIRLPKTKVLGLIILLLLLLGLPLAVFLSQQVQDVRQRAAESICSETGTDTVLVIDKSNSMNWSADPITGTPTTSVEPTRTRFYQAKVAAKAFADIIAAKNATLPEGNKHKVAVVSFSNSARTSIDSWLTTDMNDLKQKIDAIAPGDNITGSTCLECGVKKASMVLGINVQGNQPSLQPLVINNNEDSILAKVAQIIAPPVYAACNDNRDCNGTGRPYCIHGECRDCRNPGSGNDCNNNNVCNENHHCVEPTKPPTPLPTRPGPTVVPPATVPPTQPPITTPPPTAENSARPDLKNVVIILTDGKANYLDGGTSQITDTALAEQKAFDAIMTEYTRSNTVYYAIGLGAAVDINEPFLKKIGTETQGGYYFAPDADQLSSIYSTIAQTIGKGSISGTVFNDVNKNGVHDSGEDVLPNWEVKALKGTTQEVASSATSDAEGLYSLSGVCNGTYTIKETVQSGYTQTFPTNPETYTVILTTTDNQITDKHFGNVVGTGVTPSDSTTPPTSVSPDDGTKLTLSLLLHGIGAAGDNVLLRPQACQRTPSSSSSAVASQSAQQCLSNQNPLHPERTLRIELVNSDNTIKATTSGKITYDNATGTFNGTIGLGTTVQTGTYIIRVYSPGYLSRQVPGVHTITSGGTYTVPITDLVSSDVNEDNNLTVNDYSLIIACYTFPGLPATCPPDKAEKVDVNDDGKNDEFDENLFRRDLSVQRGD